uniref:VWFD domain-containing protein n=1 Tax=Biomphalaria glabrata TaxID=6526 RepID=A0A2C9L6R6_BIOGL
MGHTDYAVEALASLFELCLSIVGRSVNLWIDNKPDRSYLDGLCLNNCNNNGNCTNGVCQCRSGFIGIDCSIKSTTPPAINNMVPSSCDVLHDKCDIITLIGGPFADTNQLICIFEEINYFGETNFSRRNRTERVFSQFITYEKISCTIPYKASFKVTVQNTVNISSSPVIYQTYSSECFNCNQKPCTIWPKYCFITNVCYKVTQSNSSNPDLVCDPEKSRSDWTDRKDFPKIDAKPQVKTQFNLNSSDFVFVCDWAEYRNNNSNITVWAQWYIDDNFVLESQVQSNDSNHQVSYRSLIGLNYTSKIYCGLVACNVNLCNKSRSPIIRSPDFNLQIKIVGSTSLAVTEGAEDRVFRMSSNFPPLIFCDQNKTTDCNLFISLKIVSSAKDIRCPDANNVLPQLVVQWSSSVPSQQPSCGVVFTNSNWQLVQTVYVRAVVDGLIDGDQTRYIEVSAHLTETYIVAVETITVKILDSDRVAICQSINDPHMTTFDGMYYNNFNVGEFILYRHTTLPHQVHAYYRKCNNNKASCNCAVVVQSGKQVFRLDRCGPTQNLEDRLSPLQVDMINDGPQSPDLMIVRYNDGKKYEITFVTGTKVVVTVGRKYINIVIQASSYDYGNSEGLCGSFDKNSANDLMIKDSKLIATDHDTFSLSWRVKPADSMFGGFCGTIDTVSTTDTYCTCGNISACSTNVYKSNCQAGLKNIFRGVDITIDLYATALQPNCAYKFEYDTTYVPQVPTWPTANFTEASARQYCENSIRSTISGPACLGNVLQSVDFDYLIKGCMEDILIFDSTEFFMSTLDNLNMRCLINLQVDLKYWIIESNQVYINKSLVGNICPEDCNNKGQCKEGICVCNQNFSGPACDIDIRKPPTVIDVGDKRICDSNIQICKPEFHIYGENFLNNPSLTCHLKQITIVNKTIQASDQEIKVAAKFININKVICLVNKSLSYAIAISNDGMLISSYYNYWLYNSTCVSCTTKPEACTIKTDTCFIDNTCYMFNQTSPYNDSETCQPASSQTSFTFVKPYPNIRQPEISTSKVLSSPFFQVTCTTSKADLCLNKVSYRVKWENSTGAILNSSPLQCGQPGILTLNDLHGFKLGDSLRCAIQGFYDVNNSNTYSEWRYSDIITTDIQIPESSLQVTEDGQRDRFHISSHFPPGFFCGNLSDWENCTIHILFRVQQNQQLLCQKQTRAQIVFSHGETSTQCGIQLTKDNWEMTSAVDVIAIEDNLLEPVQEMKIIVTAQIYQDSNKISERDVATINVTVQDSQQRSQCFVGTTIQTFDKKLFNNYKRGEFILYQHKSQLYEVRSLQSQCHSQSNLTCLCGIMVLSGDDVVVFDKCGNNFATDVRLYVNGDLTPGTKVLRYADGLMYKVNLPTGGQIEVIVNQENLNAVIYGSSSDFGMAEGLCGNDDSVMTNDFLLTNNSSLNNTGDIESFIQRWRADTSWINGACQKVEQSLPKVEVLCQCESSYSSCSAESIYTECDADYKSTGNIQRGTDITKTLIEFARTPAGCCDLIKEFEYTINTEYQPAASTWPTSRSYLTKENITTICYTKLNQSVVMGACNKYLLPTDLDFILNSCISDLQVTEDTTATNTYVTMLLWSCVHTISTNVNLWMLNSTSYLPPDLGFCLTSDMANCTCLSYSNCAVSKSSPPTLYSQGGTCDLSSGTDCNLQEILGSGFVNSENLTCHITINGTEIQLKASFISSTKVICNVTLTSSADIQISLNGVNKSSVVTWTLYDGYCQTCNGQNCTEKPGICYINNKCFEPGHIFKDDPTRYCGANNSNSWTVIPGEAVFVKPYPFATQGNSLVTYSSNVKFDNAFSDIILSALGQSVKISKITFLDTDSTYTKSALQFGFTLQFTVKLKSVCDGFILNTWGERETGSGPAVSICKGWVVVTVRTLDREWSLQVAKAELNKAIKAEISWAASLGLSVKWNDMVYNQENYKVRHTKGTLLSDLFIGSVNTSKCFIDMTFGSLNIFSAAKPVLLAYGVTTEMPTLLSKPTISVDFKNETSFICSFTTLKRADVKYTVTFSIDEQLVQNETLNYSTNMTVLSESFLSNVTYGSKIVCSVTPCYVYNCQDLSGPTFSETFTITIEILERHITLVEGGNSASIQVISKVPPYLFCPPSLRASTNVSLNAIVTVGKFSGQQTCQNGNVLRQVVIGFNVNDARSISCGQVLTTDIWTQGLSIPLQATVDMVKDGDVTGNINVTLTVSCLGMYNTITSEIVEVTVVDKDTGKICQSVNDPHMLSFDGVSYNNFKEGEFVFYKHTSLPYAVHTFYRKCNKDIASCNCAVAVKVDDDVAIIDRCGPQSTKAFYSMSVKIIKNGNIDPAFRIFRYDQGNQYKIVLPTGTTVIVENGGSFFVDGPQFLNVWITASSADYNRTQGLCGTYDDNQANDFFSPNGINLQVNDWQQTKFSEFWRVTGNESLYSGYCPEELLDDLTYQYCSCLFNDSQPCSANENIVFCNKGLDSKSSTFKYYEDITALLIEKSLEPDHCYDPDTVPVTFDYEINYTYDVKSVQWPTPSNLEENYVRKLCTETITNTYLATAGCDKKFGIDIQKAIEFCVLDIKMTDDISWTTALQNNIRIQCITQISLQTTTQLVNLCPSNCNNHGNCTEYQCLCEEPYDGFDCSIDRTKPPTILNIVDGSLCDLVQDDCSSATLTGYPFSAGHAICRLQKLTIDSTGIKKDPHFSDIKATFISTETVRCDFNETGSWAISISNDGKAFSEAKQFISYDSNCQKCDLNPGCIVRDDVCTINKLCYENGAVVNDSFVCNLKNKTTLTPITSSQVNLQIYNFLNIIGNILNTGTVTFEVFGNPVLISGPFGGNAILLNGIDQYLNFSSIDSTCLGDLSKCPYGITIKFSLAIFKFKNQMYILSCGADTLRTSGLSIWYQGNKLNARIRNGFKEWKVMANFKPSLYQSKFVDVKLSWSVNNGLVLFLDNKLASYDYKYKFIKYALSAPGRCYFARPLDSAFYSNIAISDVSVVFAFHTMINYLGINFELPRFVKAPTLELLVNSTTRKASFICSFDELNVANLTYFVDFYYGKKYLKNKTAIKVGNKMVSVLSEDHIDFLWFRQSIFCEISACITDQCNSTLGPTRQSNKITAEFKIDSKPLEVYEGEQIMITLDSILPPRLFCLPEDRDTECYISVQASLIAVDNEVKCPNQLPVTQLVFPTTDFSVNGPCKYRITSTSWANGSLLIPILGTIDQLKDGKRQRDVKIVATALGSGSEFSSTIIETVKVVVLDRDSNRKVCQATGDPHFKTFDGMVYDNFLEGEYVLFRHKKLPYEVRAFQQKCNDRAACNCGVAVRSGDDIIVLERCTSNGKLRQPLMPKYYSSGELTVGTKYLRLKSGGYKILLPTGMSIEVHGDVVGFGSSAFDVLNIFISATAFDYQQSTGLCGNFDSDETNDLTTSQNILLGINKVNEFILSWRVNPKDSYYSGICVQDVVIPKESLLSCNCEDEATNIICSVNEGLQTCQNVQSVFTRDETDITDILIKSTDSSDACIPTQDPLVFQYDVNYTYSLPTWPTKSGITKQKATEYCTSIVEISQTYQTCKNIIGSLTGTTLYSSLQNCISDIQIMDDLSFAQSILVDIQVYCLLEIKFNVDLWISVNGTLNLLNNICPNDCNNNGTCVAGTCQCNSNWLGTDCSINKKDPPLLVSIDGGDKCDKRKRDCQKIEIYGMRFVQSDQLVCHIKYMYNSSGINIEGQYISTEIVVCPFEVVGEFQLTISNDGVSQSNSLNYTTYDSVCQDCSASPCRGKENICGINGICYADGYHNPLKPELACLTTYSNTQWTNIKVTAVEQIRILFFGITNGILNSSIGSININGSLSISEYVFNRRVVVFIGEGGFRLERVSPCLSDFEQCQFGFIISLHIKFDKLVENGYLLTSCGDQAYSSGIAVYYKQSRLYFIVTTRTSQWIVYLQNVDTTSFHNLDISWSSQMGLKVFIDSVVVSQQAKPVERKMSVSTRRECGLFVGTSETGVSLLHFTLELLHIIAAEQETVNALGIVPGLPTLLKKPVLSFAVDETTGKVNLSCEFEKLQDTSLEYLVTFIKEDDAGVIEYNTTYLSEDDLNDLAYNTKLSCKVSVCFSTNCLASLGKESHSDFIYATFEIRTTLLSIYEGEVKDVVIHSNVPPRLFCPHESRDQCSIKIDTTIKAPLEQKCPDARAIPQAVIVWKDSDLSQAFCGLLIDTTSWEPTLTLHVKGTIDVLKDKDQKRILEISMSIRSNTTTLFSQSIVGRVPITVVDLDRTSTCGSENDPHITTFDGSKYNNFQEGEFRLYRHKDLSYEVHTFYRSCRGRASCNCGVAVKVDDDVILLSKCPSTDDDNEYTPLKVVLYRNGYLAKGFRIYQYPNDKFRIYLPNGDSVYVKVQRRGRLSRFINVWVTAAGGSFGNTEGLCSTFDNNADNDLQYPAGTPLQPKAYSLIWRVPQNESLYNGFCGDTSMKVRDQTLYCQCQNNEPSFCSSVGDVVQCSKENDNDEIITGGTTTSTVTKITGIANRQGTFKQGIDITPSLFAASEDHPLKCLSTTVPEEFKFNITYISEIVNLNITAEVARNKCLEQISSVTSVKDCQNVIEKDFNNTVEFCTEDYMLTGEVLWSLVAVENIKQKCEIAVTIDVDLWTLDGDGIPKLPTVVDTLCPDDCSNSGSCILGLCQCNVSYAGDNCAVNLNEAPMLYSIEKPLCDSYLKDCSSVVIYGEGFVNITSFSCLVKEMVENSNGSFITLGQSDILKATYVRSEMIRLDLTKYLKTEITCSYTDGLYSNRSLKYITYNSLCQNCDINGCSNRTDICRIQDKCYEYGFLNPNNMTQTCSSANNNSWSILSVSQISSLIRLDILDIIQNFITTVKYNLTWNGTMPPILVSGPVGEKLVSLNGNQFIMFPSLSGDCLGNINNCPQGFTVKFILKINEIKEGMVIIGNGAQATSRYGWSMWISNGLLYLRISTKTREWTVLTNQFDVGQFLNLKFTWHIQFGLKFFINDKLVASQPKFLIRTPTVLLDSTNIYIGNNIDTSVLSNIIIGGFNFLYVYEELAQTYNISTFIPTFDKTPSLKNHCTEFHSTYQLYL